MLNNYPFSSSLSNKYPIDENGMFAVSVSDANVNTAAALLLPQQQQPQAAQPQQPPLPPQNLQQQQTKSQQQAAVQQSSQRDTQQQPVTSQQLEPNSDGDVKVEFRLQEHLNGKRKHCVWDYYDLSSGKAQCRTCGRFISATTTLAKGHLKAFHPDVLVEVEQKEEHRRELNPSGATPKRRKTPQLPSQQQQQQHQMQQLQLISSEAAMNAARTASVYDTKQFLRNDPYGITKMAHQPIVRMCRTETFSAAHRLHSADFNDQQNRDIYGQCNNANGHGHNYEWKVVLQGPVSVHTGMVYDLSELKRAMAEVLTTVDHKNLDLDVEYFRNSRLVSTTENLCVYLYDELKSKLKRPELLKKVVVSETNKNQFSYSGG